MNICLTNRVGKSSRDFVAEIVVVRGKHRRLFESRIDIVRCHDILDVKSRRLREVKGKRAVGFVFTALQIKHLKHMNRSAVIKVELASVNAARIENHVEVERLHVSALNGKIVHCIAAGVVHVVVFDNLVYRLCGRLVINFFLREIDRTCCGHVIAAEIKNQHAVYEHPDVVVTGEVELDILILVMCIFQRSRRSQRKFDIKFLRERILFSIVSVPLFKWTVAHHASELAVTVRVHKVF